MIDWSSPLLLSSANCTVPSTRLSQTIPAGTVKAIPSDVSRHDVGTEGVRNTRKGEACRNKAKIKKKTTAYSQLQKCSKLQAKFIQHNDDANKKKVAHKAHT